MLTTEPPGGEQYPLTDLFHPLCGQPGLLMRLADLIIGNGVFDGLLGASACPTASFTTNGKSPTRGASGSLYDNVRRSVALAA